jgi:hypothetical protein
MNKENKDGSRSATKPLKKTRCGGSERKIVTAMTIKKAIVLSPFSVGNAAVVGDTYELAYAITTCNCTLSHV